VPLSLEAQLEARVLMMSTNNVLSPANGAPIIVPSQDMILGLYYTSMMREGMKGEGMKFATPEEVEHALTAGEVHLHAKIIAHRQQCTAAGAFDLREHVARERLRLVEHRGCTISAGGGAHAGGTINYDDQIARGGLVRKARQENSAHCENQQAEHQQAQQQLPRVNEAPGEYVVALFVTQVLYRGKAMDGEPAARDQVQHNRHRKPEKSREHCWEKQIHSCRLQASSCGSMRSTTSLYYE